MTGRRIAVIGDGVSGITAGYVLSRTDRVTLFEADDRLGGHADVRMLAEVPRFHRAARRLLDQGDHDGQVLADFSERAGSLATSPRISPSPWPPRYGPARPGRRCAIRPGTCSRSWPITGCCRLQNLAGREDYIVTLGGPVEEGRVDPGRVIDRRMRWQGVRLRRRGLPVIPRPAHLSQAGVQ